MGHVGNQQQKLHLGIAAAEELHGRRNVGCDVALKFRLKPRLQTDEIKDAVLQIILVAVTVAIPVGITAVFRKEIGEIVRAEGPVGYRNLHAAQLAQLVEVAGVIVPAIPGQHGVALVDDRIAVKGVGITNKKYLFAVKRISHC